MKILLILLLIICSYCNSVVASEDFEFTVLEARDTIISGEGNVHVKIQFSSGDWTIHHPNIKVYSKRKIRVIYESGSLVYVNFGLMKHSFYIPKKEFRSRNYFVKIYASLFHWESVQRKNKVFKLDRKILHQQILKVYRSKD